MKYLLILLLLLVIKNLSFSQDTLNHSKIQAPDSPIQMTSENWYENLNIRGYAQLRYNGLFQSNPDLGCEQCDRSWGGNNGFFFRRVRIIFFGQIHPRIFLYIQPDFASSVGNNLNYVQLRDAYFDIGLDSKNEFRFRLGQSKVPFGFENLQSSQNRLPLDRNDALNSAISNERDIGIFFYWAPLEIREMFSTLNRDGYKGSGDYGILGIGVYNGQLANRTELNDNRHVVARITYPFKIGEQIFEPSIQGYTGLYTLNNVNNNNTERPEYKNDLTYKDSRFAVTGVLYPKPFGIQAEWNWGVGPEYLPELNRIENMSLSGGYITFNSMIRKNGIIYYPFIRLQSYEGGKKHELDARSYSVREAEIGLEFLPYRNFEIVCMYTFSSRRYEDSANRQNLQEGSLLRLQFQVNF
jgi:hypothetical protein